jgi:hypothetical protein
MIIHIYSNVVGHTWPKVPMRARGNVTLEQATTWAEALGAIELYYVESSRTAFALMLETLAD